MKRIIKFFVNIFNVLQVFFLHIQYKRIVNTRSVNSRESIFSFVTILLPHTTFISLSQHERYCRFYTHINATFLQLKNIHLTIYATLVLCIRVLKTLTTVTSSLTSHRPSTTISAIYVAMI